MMLDGSAKSDLERTAQQWKGWSVEGVARKAIAYIEQLETQVPKWISVKERLPKDGELVLITMNGKIDWYKQFDHAYELAIYWSEGEDEDGEYHADGWALWDYGEGRVSDIEVFYWMPLPEPPEEETYETTD